MLLIAHALYKNETMYDSQRYRPIRVAEEKDAA
jgi:hypothetical protein